METSSFECVLDAKAAVGECPTWHRDEALLYWINSPAGHLNRFDPASGKNRVTEVGFHISSFAFRQGGGLVAATQGASAFSIRKPAPSRPSPIPKPTASML
tara:strand:+ start:1211 stop:1513 length:303 start_codon:yes stop_codon:yes gene_type:complete